MASMEESSSSSFRTPGSVPFKWELRPGIPKQPEGDGADLPASASSSLQLPPRLPLSPAAAAASPPRAGARGLASASMRRSCAAVSAQPSTATTPRHRRSMSARFATSLALPFTGPRWRGRSKDEDDVAFAAIYGDKIVS
ncbi:uncharacterized protein LOC124681163 [Lolium rigidum]|uniref:uncharacterized protein LOC124681163 n=1 Tax=Lolium rigidum TaxID=89674 RepID=UPI001F5C597A|nr:uncharacterized protein LOC124681163 [Lolium rigidum]